MNPAPPVTTARICISCLVRSWTRSHRRVKAESRREASGQGEGEPHAARAPGAAHEAAEVEQQTRVGSVFGCAGLRELGREQPVQTRQVVPRHAGIEVVHEMIVEVAHEKRDEPVRTYRAGHGEAAAMPCEGML